MEKKQLTNLEIAELLRDVAASYQLKDEKKNRFKIVAYQRAARFGDFPRNITVQDINGLTWQKPIL